MKNFIIFVFLTTLLSASSVDSWEELFISAKNSCLAKSNLKNAKLLAEPIDYEKNVIVMIKGAKKLQRIEICIYNKATKKVEINEAFDILACDLSEKKDSKFHDSLKLSDEITISVDEDTYEPRATGSYTLKAYYYDISNGDLIDGVVKQRDGFIKEVIIKNIDKEKKKEIIIKLETLGSGKYFTIDVFKFIGNKLLYDKQLSKKLTQDANVQN